METPHPTVEGRVEDEYGRQVVPRRAEEQIWALATLQSGVVAHRQLAGIGLTNRMISRASEALRWQNLHRGVYAVGHGAVSQRGRWIAAVLACGPEAALSHWSAAVLRGWLPADRGLPDVSVPRGGGRGHARIAVHRVARVESTAEEGIVCTTAARTLVDLAGVARRRTLERAVDQAAVRRQLDTAEIEEVIGRISRPRGVRTLRAVLTEHVPESTITRSEMEERFLALLRCHGLPRPLVNAHVEVAGRLVEVDFHWPAARLVVETDGWAFHATAAAQRRDRRRDRELQLAAWTVLRFTWADLRDTPELVAGQVRAALPRRGTS